MTTNRLLVTSLLGAAVAAGLGARPERADADVVPGDDSLLRPGQSFVGDVQPEETIRFTVELAKGARLRARITLKSPSTGLYIPSNFQRVSVTDVTKVGDFLQNPGIPVPFDLGKDASARYSAASRTSTFFVTDWKAPSAGRFQFAVTHRTKVVTRCTGNVSAIRKRNKTIRGTLQSLEAERTFTIPLQPDDMVRMSVRRVNARKGTAPQVVAFTDPGDPSFAFKPSQKRSKIGSVTRPFFTGGFGEGVYVVGARAPGAAVGAFVGKITVKPGGPYGRVPLSVVNSPGVDLSVRTTDGFVSLPWAASGCGVAWDGESPYVLVTGESNGTVLGRYYDLDLVDPNPVALSAILATSADLPATPSGPDNVRGHRLAFLGDRFFMAFSSASGSSAGLVRINPAGLVRDGSATLPFSPPAIDPTNDLFIANDAFTVSVGLPLATGHQVYGFDAASMTSIGQPQTIGGGASAHSAGGAAVYRKDQSVFEFWAPTTLAPGLPSNLHHGLFSTAWGQLSWEPSRVAEPDEIEQMSTSVIYDETSGVTMLHYVVTQSGGGTFGIVHRRLFDTLGNEVPGSHATLGTVPYNRPTALIIGNELYVGVEGTSNSAVIRYQLLRR